MENQPTDNGRRAERKPPYNLEAELSTMGSILLDNDVLHEIVTLLRPDDFWRDAHQTIYKAILALYEKGDVVDGVTLAEELRTRGQFEEIRGDDMLTEIVDSVPHAASGIYYARIVKEKSIKRRVIQCAEQALEEAYSDQSTGQELIESAERGIFSIAQDQVREEGIGIKEALDQAMARIGARASDSHSVTGIGSGLLDLDDTTSGFQPGQLIVIAARPSMGKTALALNIAEHVAVELEKSLLLVSLEMGNVEIAERLLCARSRVDGHKLRTGIGMSHGDIRSLGPAYMALTGKGEMFIDDAPAGTMLHITATARRLKLRKGIELVMVDYIQLISPDDPRDHRQEQIAKISRRLKTLARELKVPVIALSQLNRDVERRTDNRPRLSDLRESGAMEQDADIVLLLYRPDYYDANDRPGTAEVIVAKNRNGPTGIANLTFLKHLTRFENLSPIAEPVNGRPLF